MRPIEGIHHISLITGDAPGNVDFYARVMGLRLVKKTVNQDDPSVYHLFYSDEHGSPGADITFFEYPGARPGHAGAGMVSSIVHRVAGEAALDFWQDRLDAEGVRAQREPGRLLFADPEGMRHELAAISSHDAPLSAAHAEVPAEFALQRPDRVRAHRRARYPRSRDRPSRRLVGVRIRDRALAGACFCGRGPGHAGDRPLLLRVGLLPGAERDPLRAGDDRRCGVRRRRGSRPHGPVAGPASVPGVEAEPDRTPSDRAARHERVAAESR
jgi:catechol 2,3-dioxygenase-like lactoylglutathione lyase family enzyme